ncbi:unnamed protein product, partial [Adineta steineri]
TRLCRTTCAEYKIKTINNTTDPEWNEVFNEDPSADDFRKRAQFLLNALVDKDAVDTVYGKNKYALQESNTSGGGILKTKYDTSELNERSTQF